MAYPAYIFDENSDKYKSLSAGMKDFNPHRLHRLEYPGDKITPEIILFQLKMACGDILKATNSKMAHNAVINAILFLGELTDKRKHK